MTYGDGLNDIRIVKVYKKIDRYNSISGHNWTEDGKFLYYEVRGGFFAATKHKTLKSAKKEMTERINFNKKFPPMIN